MTTTFQDVPLFTMTGGITPEHIRAIWHIASIPGHPNQTFMAGVALAVARGRYTLRGEDQ